MKHVSSLTNFIQAKWSASINSNK